MLVRDFQSIIGKEAKVQFVKQSGKVLPNRLVACIGGGSNAMGLFYPFIKDDIKIDLTVKEFSLLEFLMKNPGKTLTRTMISEHVWNINFDSETNLVDVYIKRLREKLGISKNKSLIHSIRGVGYKIMAE